MTPWLLVAAPLAGALVVLALARATRSPSHLTAIAVMALAATLAAAMWGAGHSAAAVWPLWGPRLAPELDIQGIGRIMVVLVPAIAVPVVLYTGAYARDDVALPRLLALLTAFVGLMELLVLAADFLTLLVAWELVGACSWALIGFDWRAAASPRAARDAFLTTRVGDLGLYIAAGATFASAGSLRFDALSTIGGPALGVVAAGVLLAAAAKSGQLPFAPWLFSAMAGPTPASALLHSATMVAAGAYLLIRLSPLLAAVSWLGPAVALLGLATALAGGVVASLQSELKRALAASTSAQYGLMLVAVGAGYPGAAGAHLIAHAAFKALLFLAAGSASHATGTLELDSMSRAGLMRAHPRLAALAAVGALALAAIPPLGAAFSKEQIIAAAAGAPFAPHWLAAGVLAAALLSAFYSGRLWLLAFGPGIRRRRDVLDTEAQPHHATAMRLPGPELIALAVLAVASLALGLWYLPGGDRVMARMTSGRLPDGGSVGEVALSLLAAGTGLAAARLLWRRQAPGTLGLPPAGRDSLAAWLGLPRLARRLVVDPVVLLGRVLAIADDRAVDAGVRAAVRAGAFMSRAAGWWGERGVGGAVTAVSRAFTMVARLSSVADDRGLSRVVASLASWTEATARVAQTTDDRAVDGAVEGLAQEVGVLGARSRGLQTGLAHHYYLIVASGVLVIVLTGGAVVLRR